MTEKDCKRSLIVKNVTKADFSKYSAECNGEKIDANMKAQNPFVQKLSNAHGYMQGIAVFECKVQSGMQVTWYYGAKKINRQNFRWK